MRAPHRLAVPAATVAAGLALLLVIVSGGSAKVLRPARASEGWEFRARVKPRALPKNSPAPIGLSISNRFPPAGGSAHSVRKLAVKTDRDLGVEVRGLPTCKARQLQLKSPSAAKRSCKRSLVGRGTESLEFVFQESQPLQAKAKLLVFNGGRRKGVITLLLYSSVSSPVPSTTLTKIKIKKVHSGPYRTEFSTSIPQAGGAGSVTSLDLTIDKSFTRRGERTGVLNASCSDHRLRFEATARFADGSTASQTTSQACTQRG